MHPDRYVYDVLYGDIRLPSYVWQVVPSPELQRLREIRLCNINSLCLTGGANINRYEHAIGTSYLALKCLEHWPTLVPPEVERQIVLAALLHDVGSSAFGHSVQYVISRYGFEHEFVNHIFKAVDSTSEFSYQQASLEPIYFGMPKHLHEVIGPNDLARVAEIVSGTGEFGPLIAGTIDLDNIDNVFRLAYHIGVTRDTETPLLLAESIWVDSGELTIRRSAQPLINRWYEVRRRLYEFLLLNPDEFSAKCMLEEALAQSAAEGVNRFTWHDVDFELMEKLARSSADVGLIVARLMVGDLYGCLGIYATPDKDAHDRLAPGKDRVSLESALSSELRATGLSPLRNAMARVHTIKDVNKTERRITLKTDAGAQMSVGENTSRVLIGVFLKNKHLSVESLSLEIANNRLVQRAVAGQLSALVGTVEPLPLYGEASRQLASTPRH